MAAKIPSDPNGGRQTRGRRREQASANPRPAAPGVTSPSASSVGAPSGDPTTRRISRRALLAAGATTAAAATLAGCAPFIGKASPTPTPQPFVLRRAASLAADATVPAALAAAIAARIVDVAGVPSATYAATSTATTAPDLVLTFGALPSGYQGAAVGTSAYTAVANLRVPVDNVSSGQALGLLNGGVTDWQTVGAPASLAVKPLWLKGLPLPVGAQLAAGTTTYPTLDALLAALRSQPGSVSLLPVEAVDWTTRNLGVDGYYPARGEAPNGAAAGATSGLGALTLRLGATQRLVSQRLDLRVLAAGLGAALVGATPGGTLDMIAVGDIMLGRGVNNQMIANNDYLYPYRPIHDELMTADFRVANLECMITDLVAPPTDPYTFVFISAKRAVDGLAYAGFDTLTLANNHSNAEGQTVFQDMLATLRGNNILSCGGGDTLSAARAPAIKTVKDMRIAILSYTAIQPQGPYATDTSWGLAPIDLTTLPQDIAAARAQADIVIPYFHWGIEYTKDPTQQQQQAARAAIDAGATMVLGNHPHWTQGIENYQGRLIIYSMGNFIFDQDWSEATREGMLIHLYWRGATLVNVRFVATQDVNRCQPRVMAPSEAVGDFDRMWSGTDMLASGEYGPEPEP